MGRKRIHAALLSYKALCYLELGYELKTIGTIPELNLRFFTIDNEDSSVDIKYREYLQKCKLKKEKMQNFKDMPFDTMQSLLSDSDNEENYSKREISFIFGKKEYRLKREIIRDAEETIP